MYSAIRTVQTNVAPYRVSRCSSLYIFNGASPELYDKYCYGYNLVHSLFVLTNYVLWYYRIVPST